MKYEWSRQSADGKRFFNVGFCRENAIGTEHPASELPVQTWLRLLGISLTAAWWHSVRVRAKRRDRLKK